LFILSHQTSLYSYKLKKGVKGLADVQPEHGYTKIAHEILEITMKLKLSPTQFKIIMAVWRYTYGFNRKDHEMSLTFLADAIGAHKQGVKKDLDKLIEMRIIVVTKESTFSKSRRIAFNKNYDTWNCSQSVKQHTVSQIADSTVSQIADSTVSQIADSTVSQIADQEINIKDIYKENIKESNSSDEDLYSFFLQNIQKRGFVISPFDSQNIDQIENEYGHELVLAAMKLTAKNGKDNIGYVEGILSRWNHEGVKTIEDARKLERDFNQSKKTRKGYNKKPIRTEVLPGWFDEEQKHRMATPEKEPEADAVAKKQELEEMLSEFRSK
jgi:phage replication O-like protein O